MLAALYNGHVQMWDYEASTLVKSFELCELPVRSAKFIVRKQLFAACSDDMYVKEAAAAAAALLRPRSSHLLFLNSRTPPPP
jgi:hypothetical protein